MTAADRVLWIDLGERLAAADPAAFEELAGKVAVAVEACEEKAYMEGVIHEMAEKGAAGGPFGAGRGKRGAA